MYLLDERIAVFKIHADGTTEDLFETTITELLGGLRDGPSDISDLLDEASRAPLSGLAGGWRLLDTN